MTANQPIVALDLGPDDALDPWLEAYFAKCREKLGFVPNVLKVYAFDAQKLRGFIDMVDNLMLAPSGLTKLEREMIAVAVSAVNDCHYCLRSHGAALRVRGENADLDRRISQDYRTAGLEPRQRAMLDFAVKLTSHPADIVEADRQSLRDAGLTDRDIWDVIAVASFFNMSNRMAAASDMQPNAEYEDMGRQFVTKAT